MILRHSILYLLGIGAHRGLLFLLLPFFTRVLSVEDFGVLGVALAGVSILALVDGLNPGPFIIARFHLLARDVLASSIGQSILLAVAMFSGAAVAVLLMPSAWLGETVSRAVLVLLLAVALNRALLSIAQTLLQMDRRAAQYAAVSCSVAGITLAIVWMIFALDRFAWWSYFLGEGAALVGVNLLLLPTLARLGYVRLRPSRSVLKAFVWFSLPVVPHSLGLWAMNSIDRFLLAAMTDFESTGLYSAAYTIGLGLSLIHEAIQRALQPHFYAYLADGGEEKRRTVVRLSWASYAGLIVLFGLYYVGVRVAGPSVLGNDFLAAMDVIPILLGAFTAQGMQRVVAGHLYHRGRTGVLAMITIGAAVLNVVLNLVWIPKSGVVGAANATFCSMAASFLAVKVVVLRDSSFRWW